MRQPRHINVSSSQTDIIVFAFVDSFHGFPCFASCLVSFAFPPPQLPDIPSCGNWQNGRLVQIHCHSQILIEGSAVAALYRCKSFALGYPGQALHVRSLHACDTWLLTFITALREALRLMGYHDVYHGASAWLENPRDCEMWVEAIRAKYLHQGKAYGREEFDRLLGHCQAAMDQPTTLFAEELIKLYPEAKVVLTMRDYDSWTR